jgi:5'-3' exonuclease
MGIPSYFHSILRKKLNQCFPSRNNIIIDYLALDFNCAIYGCVRKVEKKYWNQPPNIIENRILYHLTNYIDYVIENAKPSKGIGIFVDGPVPVAKMKQQRDRRFKKRLEKEELNDVYRQYNMEIPESVRFNTNALTPGTRFMNKMCNHMVKYLEKYQNRGLEVEFSSDVEFGEGEHKCIDWLEKLQKNNNINNNNKLNACIYGLDADLVMLSLLKYRTMNLYLLREVVHYGKVVFDRERNLELLLFFNISVFATFIKQYYKVSIEEYVFLCFLLGNDFVPHHPGLNINQDGIEMVLEIYKKHPNYPKKSIIYRKKNRNIEEEQYYKIDWKRLGDLFNELSEQEYQLMLEKESYIERLRRKGPMGETEFDRALFMNQRQPVYLPPLFNVRNNKTIDVDYIRYLLDGETDIRKIVQNYLMSLEWTMEYYINRRIVSYEYYYPYHFSPMFSWISNFNLSNITKRDSNIGWKWKPTRPLTTLEQRLLVLPLDNHIELIPEISYRIIREELGYMYGEPTNNVYMFKTYSWMMTPCLPPLEINTVMEFVSLQYKNNILNKNKTAGK